MHPGVYAANVGLVLAAVVVLAGCGWVAVAPFRDRLGYALLVAPLAGILCVVTGALAVYVLLHLSLGWAGTIAVGAMLAATALALWLDRPGLTRRQMVVSGGAVLLASLLAVAWGMSATVKTGGPALVYWDGTDHLGYAHLADWLNDHLVSIAPQLDPARPYESWPVQMFQVDPRFGSFALMGLVSAATGETGTFSYEPTLVLVQVAAVLALAGAFARSPLTLVILVLGLMTCHWFDYGRTGFFGKSFGYPATFLVAILLILTLADAPVRVSRLVALAGLVIGAALAYSGIVTTFFLGVLGGGFLLTLAARRGATDFRTHLGGLMEKAAVLLALGVIAIAAGSTLARPLSMGSPDWGVNWAYIFPRIAEMESQGMPLSGLGAGALLAASWVTFAGWLWLGGLAVARWEKEAMAVLLAPLGLLGVLYLANARAVTFQLIGTFYPLALLGFGRLFDSLRAGSGAKPAAPRLAWATLTIVIAIVGLHQIRFAGAVARYGGGKTPPEAIFTKAEVAAVAAFVGRDRVEVDVVNPQPAVVLMVELGRRGANLQWSAGAWKTLFGYRGWPAPRPVEPAKWRIVPAGTPDIPAGQIALRGPQYWVLAR